MLNYKSEPDLQTAMQFLQHLVFVMKIFIQSHDTGIFVLSLSLSPPPMCRLTPSEQKEKGRRQTLITEETRWKYSLTDRARNNRTEGKHKKLRQTRNNWEGKGMR